MRALLIWIVALGLIVLAGCRNETAPPTQRVTAPPATTASAPETQGTLNWAPSFEAALKQASTTGKPLMVDFFATWCGPCRMLDEKTYRSPEVIVASADYVCAKVDVDQRRDLAEKYKVEAMPTILFLDSAGQERHRQVGYIEAPEMLNLLRENR